jgi:mRNA interferase MazF
VPLTSNLKWGDAPGNVVLASKTTGLAKDSVANVSQILTIDRELVTECAGRVSKARVHLILAGLDVVLGR